ncbi:MAG: glutamate--cysteine ligase [Proteobacteria bacterium]|nr:MAG: glutamate--cysteine ligase [Pseudomonadota bacterium]
MTNQLEDKLRRIEESGATSDLCHIRRGIEKESLRVGPDGVLARTPHPESLGSALTHDWITTDYSESLLEFITPVHDNVESMLEFLTDLHVFTYRNIGDEILWTNSMPCILHGDESIPIAHYGTSNAGFMKHVYRRGLGYRYGRLMQTIAGIHYNFSLPESFFATWLDDDSVGARSAQYLNLLRNFHRHCWLMLYLFGSAPAVCRTFVEGRDHTLTPFGKNSFFLPHGTTLRMSRLGYQNSAQSDIHVCTNSIEEYIDSLRGATEKRYPPYERIGVNVDGDWRQLNANLLQIENEFYTVIRPKRTIRPLEKPTTALKERGVEYVEVRIIDLNPFEPIGIDAASIRFMDAFLLYCMLEPSAPIDRDEESEIAYNRDITVTQGRADSTQIYLRGEARPFRAEAHAILDGIERVADMLDRYDDGGHAETVRAEREKVDRPELTASARIIEEMRANDDSYFEYAMRTATRHEEYFQSRRLPQSKLDELTAHAASSLDETRRMEAETDESFAEFLARYFAG